MKETTPQRTRSCNAHLCILATAWIYRNAKMLCQNAIDLCSNVDPVHSLEGVSNQVANGTVTPSLFDRRISHVI